MNKSWRLIFLFFILWAAKQPINLQISKYVSGKNKFSSNLASLKIYQSVFLLKSDIFLINSRSWLVIPFWFMQIIYQIPIKYGRSDRTAFDELIKPTSRKSSMTSLFLVWMIILFKVFPWSVQLCFPFIYSLHAKQIFNLLCPDFPCSAKYFYLQTWLFDKIPQVRQHFFCYPTQP